MGQEIECAAWIDGKRVLGKALLETSELLFRGDVRLKIPFASIVDVDARDGELHIKSNDELAVFEIGDKAEAWRDKILHPKTVLEKLGVKSGQAVALRGTFDTDFLEDLKKTGASISSGKDAPWIFFLADSIADLSKLPGIARQLKASAALWIVYAKGKKEISETSVIQAGRKAGLIDVKVVRFSATHTALKFVVPKSQR